jgi:hypothetical protein
MDAIFAAVVGRLFSHLNETGSVLKIFIFTIVPGHSEARRKRIDDPQTIGHFGFDRNSS